MTLLLEITSPQPGEAVTRCTFNEGGGSIGREASNAWVLPHSKVSGLHALISYRNGSFYIEDRSRNGVCLNSPRNRLERGRPYALSSRDLILIDPYTIRVSVTPAHDERPRPGFEGRDGGQRPDRQDLADPFAADDPFAPAPINSLGLDTPADDLPRQALDPMELLNLQPPDRALVRKVRTGQDLQTGSLLDDVVHVPASVPDPARSPINPPASASSIPEDYDPLAPDDVFAAPPPARERLPEPRAIPARVREVAPAPPSVAAVREPAPLVSPPAQPPVVSAAVPPPRVAPTSEPRASVPPPPAAPVDVSNEPPRVDVDFAAVLRGAGLDPAEVTPEVAQEFGQILRVVVAGVMDVMRSRQQIKDEFRMAVTRVRPIENNPLKFSADVDDALQNLLLKRNRAYLRPVDAFEDAFADLRHHQIAMLSGMRVAFEAMLAEFDPDRLQEEFDRQGSKGLVPARLRYWDLYREKRREIVKDAETSFRRLFGETFARAYEEQLHELKARERGAGGAGPKNRKPPDP